MLVRNRLDFHEFQQGRLGLFIYVPKQTIALLFHQFFWNVGHLSALGLC